MSFDPAFDTWDVISENKHVRILIGDLVEACCVLGEVKVVAAGSMYATLETDTVMRQQLSKNGIHWSFD